MTGAGQTAIRDSTETDLPAITAIYGREVASGTSSFELTPPSRDEMAARRRALVDRGFPYLVALRGTVVAGYAYAGPYRPRPAYRHSVECSIYVASDHRGQGVGTELLAALIARCEADGFRQMVAIIGDRAPASVALHRAQGFREVGVLHAIGFKLGRWLDTLILQRPLGPGADTGPRNR